MVRREGAVYISQDVQLHLSPDSEFYRPYRILMRMKALERIQQDVESRNYNFSVFLSCDPKTKEEIQEQFLRFIGNIQKRVSESSCKEVYKINFDLLKWG